MATQKFRDLVHYIIWKCEDPSQLGATKLNKITWFADTLAFLLDGESITGETYVKQKFGPVPRSILPVLRQLSTESKVIQRDPQTEYQPREYVALTAPDPAALSEREVRLIDALIEEVCKNHTAASISDLTHDKIWDAAEIGEEIPLTAVLAANPGEVVEEDKVWADEIVARIVRHGAAT